VVPNVPKSDNSPMSRQADMLEIDPVIERYMGDIDRTLLRQNLDLSPEERLAQLQELSKFADELRRAGARALNRAR